MFLMNFKHDLSESPDKFDSMFLYANNLICHISNPKIKSKKSFKYEKTHFEECFKFNLIK